MAGGRKGPSDEMEGQNSSSLGELPPLSEDGQRRMRESQGKERPSRAAPLTHSPGATAASLQGSAGDRAWQQGCGCIPDFLGTCLLCLCMKLHFLSLLAPFFLISHTSWRRDGRGRGTAVLLCTQAEQRWFTQVCSSCATRQLRWH